MKRILIIVLPLMILMSSTMQASHNRAGEITVKQLSALTFEATITTYTKTSSLQADRDSLELFWGDGAREWVQRNNGLNNNGVPVAPDIKKNTYTTTHIYSSIGTYTLYMTDPNRNAGILNVYFPYSDQVPFHIETEITILSSGTNTTPIFLNPPIDNGCTNQLYQHNPAAIDNEGDSIVFSLIIPLQGVNNQAPNYQYPHLIGGSGQSLFIDKFTGTVNWNTPQQAGEYNIAILIREYRNGTLISKTIRDMQITIEGCSNIPPAINSIAAIQVEAGDTVNLAVNVNDMNNNMINFTANSVSLINDGTFSFPATFSVSGNNTNQPIGNFQWITDCDHVRSLPYYVVFRAEDDFISNTNPFPGVSYMVVPITVVDNANTPCGPIASVFSSQSSSIQSFKLFPNPSRSTTHIQIQTKEQSKVQIQVMNMVGQVMESQSFTNSQWIEMPIDVSRFASGIYLVRVVVNGQVMTKKLMVE